MKPSGRMRPSPPSLRKLKDRKTMSKINLAAPLLTRAGDPAKREDGRTQTTGLLLLDLVDFLLPDDEKSKMKLVRLGDRLASAIEVGEIDLSKADCTLLLERATKLTNALAYGHLVKVLDPEQLADV